MYFSTVNISDLLKDILCSYNFQSLFNVEAIVDILSSVTVQPKHSIPNVWDGEKITVIDLNLILIPVRKNYTSKELL